MSGRRMFAIGSTVLLTIGLALGGATQAQAAETDTVHALANQARWDNGLAGLVRSTALDAVATQWANEMAADEALSHNPDLGSDIPSGWTAAAENVATGYANGAAVHNGWMNSSGHRANLLGDFTDIGIAFISAGGTTWGVQVFAKYPGHVGPAAPQPAQPDPQPTEIEDPTVKPTLPVLPTVSPTPTESPTPTVSPTPTGSPSTTAPGEDVPGSSATVVIWVIVLGALVAAAIGLWLVVLARRRGRSGPTNDADPDSSELM